MKKIYLLLVLSAAVTFVSAQGLQLGIKAGLNNGTMSTKISGVNEGAVQRGFVGGVFGRASLLGFFVQPEISFAQREGAFEIQTPTYANDGSTYKYKNTLNYMDLTAMFGYSLAGVVRLNAGPSLITLLSASHDADQQVEDKNFSKDYFNTTAWGFQFGAGVDISRLCVDIRYDINMSNLGKNNVTTKVNNTEAKRDYSTGYSIFQITLGYKIIKL